MLESDALGAAFDGIAKYMEENVELETHTGGTRNVLGVTVDGMKHSARKLRVAEDLIWLSNQLSQYQFTELLAEVAQKPAVYEHFASEFGYESLQRAQTAANRFPTLLRLLNECSPPERSTKYLESAATCFLYGFDRECVAMCRGAVEVLVEERYPDQSGETLAPTIKRLRDARQLEEAIAADMLEINSQAREVLHDVPARNPPNAEDCLFRLARILRKMFAG